jgi:hypothetical protein
MTRLRLILFISACFFFSSIWAQKPAYQTGKHIPPAEAKKKKNRYSNLYASSEDEFFVSDRTKEGQVISVYDVSTLKKKSDFTLDNPKVNGKSVNWYSRFFDQDQVTTIYSYYDKKEDKNTVYGVVATRSGKEVVKEKVMVSFNASKKKEIGDLGIIRSKDKTKFLIYREPADHKGAQESVDVWLYDDMLAKVYKKKLKFPYQSKQFSVDEYLLTDAGKVIIIAHYTPTKDEKKDGVTESYKIFGVTENNEELDEIEFGPAGNVLSSASAWVLDSGNSIAFTGFYRGDKKKRGATGIYYVRINTSTWAKDVVKFNKISEDDMNKIMLGSATSEKAKKRAKKSVDKGYGLNAFLLKTLLYDNEGNVRIITQVEFMTEVCTYDPKTQRETCMYFYHNDKIVEFDLDKEGNIAKTIVIPKAQVIVLRDMSLSYGGLSFTWVPTGVISPTSYLGHIMLYTDDKVYYIYNDNDANMDKKKVAKKDGNNFYYIYKGAKKSRLVYAYNSDKKDKAVKKAMTDSYKTNIQILPAADVIHMKDGSVIVWGKVSKSKELILMRFYLQ